MSSRFNIIAQLIFKKPLSECSIAELEKLTHDYPAFAAGHFLRAKAEQQSGILNSKTYFQKAALYHHQPATFDLFLADNEMSFEVVPSQPLHDEIISESAKLLPTDDNTIGALTEEREQTIDNTSFASEDDDESTEDEVIFQQPIVEPLAANDDEAIEKAVVNESSTEQDEDDFVDANNTAFEPEAEAKDELESKEPEALQLPTLQSSTSPEPPLAFEPYHTVDYFASQGIKLSQSELPKDKFGKQVMSFTAWLKTMKRLPASEQIKSLDPQQEQKVEHMAAHSVEGDEVLTETMAEVWLKQGATEKAAEVYRKLSLLHPAKRAYFAAKIQQIK